MRFHIFPLMILLCAGAAPAQDHTAHQHQLPAKATAQARQPQQHAQHATNDTYTPDAGHMAMQGMYGPYPMSREASGTSWQPDSTAMEGMHRMYGPWMTMVHGYVNAVYDHQGGPRGDEKTFAASMLMAMAQRKFARGTLGLRAMLSLDPAMGKTGYPLLFQTGETADGREHLIDRQHPHDLFMELAASYSVDLTGQSSVFVYAGLPGEPALGPPAFMHRASGHDNPEAPLSHHWLDSTHITFGVVTAGAVYRNLKIEASAFNGREPDQHRWNIETRSFDSASARISYNPSSNWSLQLSHGTLDSPELLEPDVAIRRTTASATVHQRIGTLPSDTTLAWGRNRKLPGGTSDAVLLESALAVQPRTKVFGRFERIENGELFEEASPLHGRVFTIRKLSVGVVHDFYKAGHMTIGAGALASKHWAPSVLDSVYGSSPSSTMLFLRAKIASH